MSQEAASAVGSVIASLTYRFQLLNVVPSISMEPVQESGLYADRRRSRIAAIAVTRLPFGGRVIRSVAISVREMPFVEAGRAAGASQLRVMTLHVLPQCIAPYLVLATTHLGVAIVIEAALGFLGVGVPPPTPTWGNMLADAITGLIPHWWLVLFPGLAITITVLAFNLLGDGIRDTLDPKLSPAVLRLVTGAGKFTAVPTPAAVAKPSDATA